MVIWCGLLWYYCVTVIPYEWLRSDNAPRQFPHILLANSKKTQWLRHNQSCLNFTLICISLQHLIFKKKLIKETVYFRSQVKAWGASCSIGFNRAHGDHWGTRCHWVQRPCDLTLESYELHTIACLPPVFTFATFFHKLNSSGTDTISLLSYLFSKQMSSTSTRANYKILLQRISNLFLQSNNISSKVHFIRKV